MDRAYADDNEDEALDSQTILDEFRATYGVGLVRRNPPTPVERAAEIPPYLCTSACKQALIFGDAEQLSSSPPPEEQFARQQRWSQGITAIPPIAPDSDGNHSLNTAKRQLLESVQGPNQEEDGWCPPNEVRRQHAPPLAAYSESLALRGLHLKRRVGTDRIWGQKLNASSGPRRARTAQLNWADSRMRDEAAPTDPGNHRQRASSPVPPTNGRELPPPIIPPPRNGASVPATRPSQKLDDANPSHQPPPPRLSELLLKRRMDFSDSPTQSNNDRSYEDYRLTQRRATRSSQSDEDAGLADHPDTQQTHVTDDRRTLHEDDTGAVNFDLVGFEDTQEDESALVNFDLDPFPQETRSKAGFSDATTDSDPEADPDHDYRDGDGQDEAELPPAQPWARTRVPLSHCRTSSNSMPPPQTPLLGGRVFGKSSLLDGSQMFTQTSGIKKALSPTSSRPSPRIFPNDTISPNPNAISSPLRDRGLRTSPVHGATSSPDFPLTARDPVDFEHETDTVPASPPFKPRNTRRMPEPISSYVRSSPSLGAERNRSDAVDFDSDSEEEYRKRMNRLRVKRKQTEAVRSMSFVSVSRPSSGEEERGVVPSTHREKKRTRARTPAQQYLDQCHGKYSSDKDDARPATVANSQGVATKGGETDVAERSSNEVEQALRDSQGPAALPRPHGHDDKRSRNPRLPAIEAMATSSGRDLIPETSPLPTAKGPRKAAQVPSNQSTQVDTSSVPLQSSAARSSDAQVAHPSGEQVPGTGAEDPVPKEADKLPVVDAHDPDDQGTADYNDESLPSTLPPDADPPETHLHEEVPAGAGVSPVPDPTEEETRSPAPEEVNKLPDAEEAPVNAKPNVEPEAVYSTPPAPSTPTSSSQPIRRSGRVRNVATPSGNPSKASVPPPSSSSLTELTLTPVLSPSSTPDTAECERDDGLRNPSALSPAVARVQRQVRPRHSLITYSPARRREEGVRRNSVRSVRLSSVSTDGLASPGSVSDTRIRSARSLKIVNDISQAHSGLFQGMVFAISFQSNDEKAKKQAETWIRQEGGSILETGFNELFEPGSFALPADSSVPFQSGPLQLMPTARDAGFTALIADNHSRKVKYMQALALGLPCLSWKWISACVAKNQLVDWTSYVLCAGPSMVLGNAIRSRSLTVYDAAKARLQDVMDQRPKLLESTEVLLFMKKSRSEEKRMPYMFLAQILGAALVRAHTLDEARAKLREREEAGQAFDWVYIDDNEAGVEQALFAKPGQSTTRKRKRSSADLGVSGRAPKRIRKLTDELVVQSLILGRLVEEGELNE